MTNLFEINYIEKISAIFAEAFKFKKYKAMGKASAVFSGILMIPFVVISFFAAAVLFCLSFVVESTSSLVKSLHTLLRDEGQAVKHGTQIIVYFFAWPAVFSLYAFQCLLLAWTIPTYALLAFLVYLWSFGGIKFHLFVKDAENLEVEVKEKYNILPVIFALCGHSILFIVPIIHGISEFIKLYSDYMEELFSAIFFGTIYPRYVGAYLIFVVLFALIGMVSRPRVNHKIGSKE